MAVTITRSVWIDDDGTGQTGTVINQALHTTLYNEIDAALAKVAQLAGGNAFTGNQAIAGVLTVTGVGGHGMSAGGTGANQLLVQNTAAGTGNYGAIVVGNDANANLVSLQAYSSTFTSTGSALANGATLVSAGAGGLSVYASVGGALRFYTGAALERLRIAPTGELLVNTAASVGGARVTVVVDSVANAVGLAISSSNVANTLFYAAFYNSAGGTAGYILQTGATSVQYATTSDARLKDDAGRATDLSALRAVVVHDFTWKADGIRDRGVFAQEAHEHFPRAVSQGTDDLTDGGDLARPWGTDYSKFVPDLIVGWQQHDAEIADLRALLATVKG